MNIRLIAMDLDGTALTGDRKHFSPRLCKALEDAHSRGVTVVPVTGRQYELLPPALQGGPVWGGLCVLCNGAQIRELETGKLLYRVDIDKKDLTGLLEIAERFELPIELSVEGRLHLTEVSLEGQKDNPELKFHREVILPGAGVIVDSLVPLCSREVEKVNLLCIRREIAREVEAELSKLGISAVWSAGTCMEITHANANKGNGIRQLCRMLDIPLEAVMALGDSGNDISMLRQAGLGVAMGNAPDFVKKSAAVCTETNENDGAALAIERYVLGR